MFGIKLAGIAVIQSLYLQLAAFMMARQARYKRLYND